MRAAIQASRRLARRCDLDRPSVQRQTATRRTASRRGGASKYTIVDRVARRGRKGVARRDSQRTVTGVAVPRAGRSFRESRNHPGRVCRPAVRPSSIDEHSRRLEARENGSILARARCAGRGSRCGAGSRRALPAPHSLCRTGDTAESASYIGRWPDSSARESSDPTKSCSLVISEVPGLTTRPFPFCTSSARASCGS